MQSVCFCRLSDPFSFPSGKWGCWTRGIWHPHLDSFLSLSLGLAHHWHFYKEGSRCFGHLLHGASQHNSPSSRLTTGIFRWHLHSPTHLGSVRGGWIHPQLPLPPPPRPVTSSKLIHVSSSPWRFCHLSWSKQLKPRNFVCWLQTKIPSSPGNVNREHTIPKLVQAHTFDDITTIKVLNIPLVSQNVLVFFCIFFSFFRFWLLVSEFFYVVITLHTRSILTVFKVHNSILLMYRLCKCRTCDLNILPAPLKTICPDTQTKETGLLLFSNKAPSLRGSQEGEAK